MNEIIGHFTFVMSYTEIIFVIYICRKRLCYKINCDGTKLVSI